MPKRRILIVAGEASSDAHGAGLVKCLKARGVDADFFGVGGTALSREGMELIAHADELAVVGLFEALSILPRAIRILRRIRRTIKTQPPDLFIPIDSPDFNLRLVATAHSCRVPVLYFIAPQLWAWRSGRVKQLQKYISELLVLFPFEKQWFASRDVKTTFIGHPKLDAILDYESSTAIYTSERNPSFDEPLSDKTDNGPAEIASVQILLLPGSRHGEVSRHLPVLARTAAQLRQTHPEIDFVLRMADNLPETLYQVLIGDEPITLSRLPMNELCHTATAAVSVSGTASFEVALSGTPCIVVYKMNPLSWLIARKIVRVKHVSMANIASGKLIVPEFLQGDCQPHLIAAELEELINDRARLTSMKQQLLDLRKLFGAPGAYEQAADRVIEILEKNGVNGDNADGR